MVNQSQRAAETIKTEGAGAARAAAAKPDAKRKKTAAQRKKQMRRVRGILRFGIQLVFFILFPSAYSAAFSGIKNLFTQIGAGDLLAVNALVTLLAVLLAYTLVFGRFFCGYACAFGSLGDWVHSIYLFICRKVKKKPIRFPAVISRVLSYVKYGLLVLIIVLCFKGMYSSFAGTSPWDVFSMIRSFNFSRMGSYKVGIVILVAIICGMAVKERFFCRFLCPMGAVFSLIPVLPFFSLRRTRNKCIRGCSNCTKICPSDIELPDSSVLEVSGDCFQCQKCIGNCPKSNVHCGASEKLHGNEIWFTVLRAGILILLLWKFGG